MSGPGQRNAPGGEPGGIHNKQPSETSTVASVTRTPDTRPPRRDRLFLVESVRYTRGRPERVTRVFRQHAAADRWATHQVETGRGPVTLWTAEPPTWQAQP